MSVGALQAGLIGEKPPQVDWPAYGRDPGGMRHSPLTQITPRNVARLQRAWVYHTGERVPNFEVTPVMVDNVLYFSTPSQRVIALDASGNATPITYMGRGDRQYVVVAAGGPGHLMTIGNTAEDRSDTVIAFALPK